VPRAKESLGAHCTRTVWSACCGPWWCSCSVCAHVRTSRSSAGSCESCYPRRGTAWWHDQSALGSARRAITQRTHAHSPCERTSPSPRD
jgi:hypothetical protein